MKQTSLCRFMESKVNKGRKEDSSVSGKALSSSSEDTHRKDHLQSTAHTKDPKLSTSSQGRVNRLEDEDDSSEEQSSDSGQRPATTTLPDGTTVHRRRRTSKHCPISRNYVCGCTKKYLSYAALYTHAKIKHSGVFPPNTTIYNSKEGGLTTTTKPRPSENQGSTTASVAISPKGVSYYDELKMWLEGYPGARGTLKQGPEPNTLQPSFSLIPNLPDKMIKPIYWEPFKAQLQSFVQTIKQKKRLSNDLGNKIHELMISYKGHSQVADSVFACFAIYVSTLVSETLYREVLVFLALYRVAFNEKIESFELPGFERQPNKPFSEYVNAEYIPDLANYFVTEFLLKAFIQERIVSDASQFTFFGINEDRIQFSLNLTKMFCAWANIYEFTLGKIEINMVDLP